MTIQLLEEIEFISEAAELDLEFSPEDLAGIESELEYDLESLRFEDVRKEMESYLEHIPESESVNRRALKVFTPLIQKLVQKIQSNPQMRDKLKAACHQGTDAVAEMLSPILSKMLPGYLSWMAPKYCLPIVQTLGLGICKQVGASEAALAGLECGCRPSRKPSRPSGNNSNYENRVIELTNQERRKRRLPPLQNNPKLAAAAEKHTRNMAAQNFLSHRGRDGSTLASRVQATGYKYSGLAENIAKGQRTPEQVVQSWMNSPGHRRNILDRGFREIGVCYHKTYWTQVFGTPR
ncbi:MAG: CAP domain-containing protein [Richelia sp. RM1_1_1]|nr:CAP domain-containing protein [Richelia sp. SM1_7_0]NJN10764.1 CAP domain-containing protein [Richelia sp. RM1_1_1]